MRNFLNKIFKLDENQTTVRVEITAGVTTFFAMCYIVLVNPSSMMGSAAEAYSSLRNACYIGGIIAAVIATLCMAFIANKPFALAAGMGLNSFFFVSFILPGVLSGAENGVQNGYYAGLTVILISGLIFLVLSVTGLRKYIAISLPACLKAAVPAGIGLFIAFLGLQNSGLVENNEFTLVQLVDLTSWEHAAPAIVCFYGFIIIIVLANSKYKVLRGGAVIFGIISATIIYYIFSIFTPSLRISGDVLTVGNMFKDWANHGITGAIRGFQFVFDGHTIGSILTVVMLVITYSLVDMFDTIGTLYGASAQAGMLDENGDPVGIEKEMLCDAIGTVAGSFTGTSTITTFVESASGVAAGGRTGLTAFTTAVLFIFMLAFGPIVKYIPSCATACALIYVGVLMLRNILSVDFTDGRGLATAFMTLIMMIATYSITNGIMVGSITYVLITLLMGKYNKRDIVVTVIACLGILRFIFVKM